MTVQTQDFIAQIAQGKTHFSRLTLTDDDLSMLRADDLTLKHCRFERVDFSGAVLEAAICTECTFVDCDFTEAYLPEARFSHTRFYEQAGECNFQRANLTLAEFEACDLRMCDFSRAILIRATFDEVNAMGASFHLARFDNAVKITNSNFRYVDLTGANLKRCDLNHTIFVQANFQEAHLTEAYLIGASLGGATWRYADVKGVDVRGADVSSFDIRTMDLTGIKIYEHQQRMLLEAADVVVFPDEQDSQ